LIAYLVYSIIDWLQTEMLIGPVRSDFNAEFAKTALISSYYRFIKSIQWIVRFRITQQFYWRFITTSVYYLFYRKCFLGRFLKLLIGGAFVLMLLFRDLLLDEDVMRMSSCELEVDVVAADILNRLQVDGP